MKSHPFQDSCDENDISRMEQSFILPGDHRAVWNSSNALSGWFTV